jgi:hypothetical protein
MSAVIVRRNHEGVLLAYHPDWRGPHMTELRFHPSDRLRCLVVKAGKELRRLEIISEHLALSEIGRSRIFHALRTIECALSQARDELGLAVEVTEDA